MEKQLRVKKADGTTEAYLHTKVIGTINNGLSAAGEPDVMLAEDLAEVVTYYLYNKPRVQQVSSNEIFSMIKAVLTATGFELAAVVLSEHALERRLMRDRTEVVAIDVQTFKDVRRLYHGRHLERRARWDKTRIVRDLTSKSGLPRQTARAMACSMVAKSDLAVLYAYFAPRLAYPVDTKWLPRAR